MISFLSNLINTIVSLLSILVTGIVNAFNVLVSGLGFIGNILFSLPDPLIFLLSLGMFAMLLSITTFVVKLVL